MADKVIRIEIPETEKPDFQIVKKALGLHTDDKVTRIGKTSQFDITLKYAGYMNGVVAAARKQGYTLVSDPTTDIAAKRSTADEVERAGPPAEELPTPVAPPGAARPAIPRKPFGMHPLPSSFPTAAPVWHDGSGGSAQELLSGEVRCEIETLTPLLVGWERTTIKEAMQIGGAWSITPSDDVPKTERQQLLEQAARDAHPNAVRRHDDTEEKFQSRVQSVDRARDRYVHERLGKVVRTERSGLAHESKSVLAPLRATTGVRPVVIPADSLHGHIRHHFSALVGSPMERVAERSYSYRPNMKFPDQVHGRRLEPRLARVTKRATSAGPGGVQWPYPVEVELLRFAQRNDQFYYPNRTQRTVPARAMSYRGGMGGGESMPAAALSEDARKRTIHTGLELKENVRLERSGVRIDAVALQGYLRTLTHYFNEASGHFSNRHPQVGQNDAVRRDAIGVLQQAARERTFQIDDHIWVEWDKQQQRVVSFGWHYYYRWAYIDTVRTHEGKARQGLIPQPDELQEEQLQLTATRRLFGYAVDEQNPGVRGIGGEEYPQLLGRLFPNNALEVVMPGERDAVRFLPPTFLKELGLPRPSAVEHYVRQDGRRTDAATLTTYGDADGHDSGGQLAGRKFYLDRAEAYPPADAGNWRAPWEDDSALNRMNERSTLALEVSRAGRRFRFTLRFRDLEPHELASVLLAMAPNQFAKEVGGTHTDGYCTKLGYARPLGMGSVRIEAKELWFLKESATVTEGGASRSDAPSAGANDDAPCPSLARQQDVHAWFAETFTKEKCPAMEQWLELMRCKHPDAGDYPRKDGEIFAYHTQLRGAHSQARRMELA